MSVIENIRKKVNQAQTGFPRLDSLLKQQQPDQGRTQELTQRPRTRAL